MFFGTGSASDTRGYFESKLNRLGAKSSTTECNQLPGRLSFVFILLHDAREVTIILFLFVSNKISQSSRLNHGSMFDISGDFGDDQWV